MRRPSLIQRYHDNILVGATLTSTPDPATSYDLNTLLAHRPSDRLLFDLPSPNTVNIRAALPSPKRGDILVIPVSNVDAGSSVLRLTNDAGLDEMPTVPDMPEEGIPDYLVVDLRLLELNATVRTSNGWNLIADGNSVPLLLGGYLGIFTAREFPERDFQWGFKTELIGTQEAQQTDHGAEFVASRDTYGEMVTLTAMGSEADRDALERWCKATFVGGYPVFVWIDPDGRNRAVAGFIEDFSMTDEYDEAIQIEVRLRALSQGKPVV